MLGDDKRSGGEPGLDSCEERSDGHSSSKYSSLIFHPPI